MDWVAAETEPVRLEVCIELLAMIRKRNKYTGGVATLSCLYMHPHMCPDKYRLTDTKKRRAMTIFGATAYPNMV